MPAQRPERLQIKALFEALDQQPTSRFPAHGPIVGVTSAQGVYVIRDKSNEVVHVGRTLRGKEGLLQRISDHIAGKSSFVRDFLRGDRASLRDGCTFQFLEVPNDRHRALLEHYATAWHCPKHVGSGRAKE